LGRISFALGDLGFSLGLGSIRLCIFLSDNGFCGFSLGYVLRILGCGSLSLCLLDFDLGGFLLRISLLFFLFSFALFFSDLGFILGLFDFLAFLSGLISEGFLVLGGLHSSICLCLLCDLFSLAT
jgi:hypothetical protein